jgi:hypothetical protein
MKIKAIYKDKVVYIIGFCTKGDFIKAIISYPYIKNKALVDYVSIHEVYIIDDKYNPYYEELQE